mgnify:CR=1 FL=1
MTTAGPSNFSVGALAPFLALAALGLGVVALVAPMPFLRPPQVDPGAATGINITPRPRPTVKPIVPEDWSSLAESFSKLREPLTAEQLKDIVQGTTPEQPVETQPEPGPVRQPLRWRYLGFIAEPERVAALVLMNDTDQRLLYAGQTLTDDADPEQLEITIVSVTDTEIVIEREGQRERFRLSQIAAESPSETSPLRHAPNTPPRGAQQGRRR